MKNYLRLLLIGLSSLATSCSLCDSNDRADVEIVNPLDSIFGDKIINVEKDSIRSNNFTSLLTLDSELLLQESSLYSVTVLNSKYSIIHQQKSYAKARSFDVLIKQNAERISKYYVTNDIDIVDALTEDNKVVLLLGDFDNNNVYWKSQQKIVLKSLNNNLQENWTYTADSKDYSLTALSLEKESNYYVVQVNVLLECDVCTNTVELKIDLEGNCISAHIVNSENTTTQLTQEILDIIFLTSNRKDFGLKNENLGNLNYIKLLFNELPTVNLPLTITEEDFNKCENVTLSLRENLQYIVFSTLPDTLNYFGFLGKEIADSNVPKLIVFNKQGEKIVEEVLAKSCWKGCESDCRFELTIDSKLQFESKFEFFEYDFSDTFCSEYPIAAKGGITYFHLDTLGSFIFDKTDTLNSFELLKNPMVHTNN